MPKLMKSLLSAPLAVLILAAFASPALAAGPESRIPPSISGSPVVGSTLTTTDGSWASDNEPLTYAYQWEECYSDSIGACFPLFGGDSTSASYQVTDEVQGQWLAVVVTATDTASQSSSESSELVGPAVQSPDTAIRSAGSYGAEYVSAIKNGEGNEITLTSAAGTDSNSVTGLERALESTDGSTQTYRVWNGSTPVTGDITTGDSLHVTAANGSNQGFYAITVDPYQECSEEGTCTLDYEETGSPQTFIVPHGVSQVTWMVTAGGGGTGGGGSNTGGGTGGSVQATTSVFPGEEFKLAVGGGGFDTGTSAGAAGGYGGGGSTGSAPWNSSSGGGGGSYVFAPDDANTTAIVAGGGGGGGPYAAGGNGGLTGTEGVCNGGGCGGRGATSSSPGAGGSDQQTGGSGTGPATSLAFGKGGSSTNSPYSRSGGGGGGGYYGGGAGGDDESDGDGGGGGGSDYLDPALDASNVAYDTIPAAGGNGYITENGDNGRILVQWAQIATTTSVTPSDYHPVHGGAVTYEAVVSPVPSSGTVSFTEEGTGTISGCEAVAVNTSTGQAQCHTNAVSTQHGDIQIAAIFTGSTDEGYAGSSGVVGIEDLTPPASSSWSSGYGLEESGEEVDWNTHGVSCASSSFCVAVGGNAARTYNGSTWAPSVNLIPYRNGFEVMAVSCPSSSFCVAVDSEANALTYNGSTWSVPEHIAPVQLRSVSCPSSSFCAAVGSEGVALTFNGSAWTSAEHIDANELNYVSCTSSTFCVAVGGEGEALTFNGSAWSAPEPIAPKAALLSVSCTSTTFCVAVGSGATSMTYNGSSWSEHTVVGIEGTLSGVSCTSSTFCVAVGREGEAVTYDGSTWSDPESFGGEETFVSCSSPSFCVAANEAARTYTADTPTPVVTDTTSSGRFAEGDTLSATNGTFTGGSVASHSYQWLRGTSSACTSTSTAISGATSSTYALQAADAGDKVCATVTATNLAGSASETSAGTPIVATSEEAPALVTSPVVTGTTRVGQVLSTSTGTWTGAPTPTYTYAWERCAASTCSYVSGATSSTYTLTDADYGDTLRSVVTAQNSKGTSSGDSLESGTIAGLGPSDTGAPTISGTAVVGSTLTATTGTWGGYPTPTYAYQWESCVAFTCSTISGATSSTYVLGGSDYGKEVIVAVTATNSVGQSTATSGEAGPIAGAAPAVTVAPAITGTAKIGQTLTASTGTWTGTPAPSYAYEWQLCSGGTCTAISGATSSTYVLPDADYSEAVEVVVTATNSVGHSSSTSAPTGDILGESPELTLGPAITGTATVGQVLTTSTGTWTGYPVPTLAYQWQDCLTATQPSDVTPDGAPGCTDIAGATGTTYTLASTDYGYYVRVLVTATNAEGALPSSSRRTSAVAGIAPSGTEGPEGPAVSGPTQEGSTLTASTGTFGGFPAPAYTYQWQVCSPSGTECTDIEGATASTYTVTSADAGKDLRVVVTATNAAGSSVEDSPVTVIPAPQASEGTTGRGTTTTVVAGPVPVISGLAIDHRCVAPSTLDLGGSGSKGLTVTFDLSAASTVKYAVLREKGSRSWTSCPLRRGDKSVSYLPVWTGSGQGAAGGNTATISSKRGASSKPRGVKSAGKQVLTLASVVAQATSGKALKPGTYILEITATDANGTSKTETVKFWIVGKPSKPAKRKK